MSRVVVLLFGLLFGLGVLLAGCGAVPVVSSAPADGPSAAAAPRVDVKAALAGLATLPVKGRAPMTGYDRDAFGPAWSDATDAQWGHNGCDTRNDVLRRDLGSVTLKPDTHGCVVLSGTLRDPYGGTTIHFVRGVGTSTAIQIDHVVALADAWQTGAQGWSAEKRKTFANDPRELLAVSGPLNESKRDGDADVAAAVQGLSMCVRRRAGGGEESLRAVGHTRRARCDRARAGGMSGLIGYRVRMVFLVIIVIVLVVIVALVLGVGMGGMRSMRQRQTALRGEAVTGQVESLRYQVPVGQDPAAVISALKLEGFEVVRDDEALQTQDIIILCPAGAERERARVRAIIAHDASQDMEGHPMDEHEVHFVDEPRTS